MQDKAIHFKPILWFREELAPTYPSFSDNVILFTIFQFQKQL